MQIENGSMLKGNLTKDQISLIVSLAELAGKLQGVSSYKALGRLLAALEAFTEVEEKTEEMEIE